MKSTHDSAAGVVQGLALQRQVQTGGVYGASLFNQKPKASTEPPPPQWEETLTFQSDTFTTFLTKLS